MKNKKILKIAIILSIMSFATGLLFTFPESIKLFCDGYFDCIEKYESYEKLGALMLFLSPIVFLISVFFLATGKTKEVLRTWRKVTIIFWVLSLPFLLSSGGGGLDVGIGDGVVLYLLLWIYFFLSLVVITFRTIQLRGRKE